MPLYFGGNVNKISLRSGLIQPKKSFEMPDRKTVAPLTPRLLTCASFTILPDTEYYMTVGGVTTEYCKGHLSDHLSALDFKCNVEDRTEDMAILSLQGPKR